MVNVYRALLLCACLCLGLSALAADFVWVNGTNPITMPAGFTVQGATNGSFLSGGRWLCLTLGAEQVNATVPEAGLQLSYALPVATAGAQELWARIGFEGARCPFDWRMDGGAWTTVTPDAITTDMMEANFFGEIAWLKLSDLTLAAGPHTLDIHITRFKNAKGENQRMLFALDAVCLSATPFIPHGKFKPGEVDRDARDEQAANNTFALPDTPAGATRSSVKLNGLWEICRDDEMLAAPVATPIAALPQHPFWKAIQVPGDKDQLPELQLAHRLWYRTHITVSQAQLGHAFFLVFPCNTLNTTVFVNGVYCGFAKDPYARAQIDVTKAIKAGANELCVGIRDIWYARQYDPNNPASLHKQFNTPPSFNGNGFQNFIYPVWNQPDGGMLNTPQFVSAGATYASDVFCIPSVAKKQLGLEVTIANPGAAAVSGELRCEAVNDATGAVEQTFAPQPFTVDPAKEALVKFAGDWATPKLWWPDSPAMYRLRSTLVIAGKPVDVKETSFGFREWSIDGIHLKLNGVNWQGFSEMSFPWGNTDDFVKNFNSGKYNYGFARMWPQHGGQVNWLGKEPEDVLDVMDRAGIPIRRQGYLDGEAIGYTPAILPALGPNWIDQLQAWIKGERNHPSIMIWSVENEVNFINARNMGQLGVWEPILHQAWDAVQKVDPTRPIMCDGGGATLSNYLPLHGDHYTTKPFWNYPQLAYEANADQNPWTWDQKRPRFIGEELFAAGLNPAYAYFGGEDLFQGKEMSRPSVGKAMQVISQGYRWYGVAACDFCQGPGDADGSQYNCWAPRAVLVRQWDWTFASGQKATRTFGIFNGSHYNDPLTFTWALLINGNKVAGASTVENIQAGENSKFDRELAMPTVAARTEAQLVLTLTANGKEVFRDVKAVTILPTPKLKKSLDAASLFVYDPQGTATAYLTEHNIAFTALNTLTAPPVPGKVWLIGQDALQANEASSTAFAAYAVSGGRVVMLEQTTPLKYQGLIPAVAEAQQNIGRTAFVEDTSHPIMANLRDKDFFTWEPGEIVYRNAYLQPSRGAKSLLECNDSLANSALMVIPVGTGVISLCQAVVSEKLTTNVTARTLFSNLLNFSADYALVQLPVAAAVDPALAKVLDDINLKYSAVADPLDALTKGKIAIISATPANLHLLATNLDKVTAFTHAGGYIMLQGLTPDGLADYNTLVGFQHMIRPFRRERVSLVTPRNHLMAGISQSDVILYSAQRIFPWQAGEYVASDTFSFVVDLDDVAPFGQWDSGFHLNLVNGMVSADGWPYICDEPNTKTDYTFVLPKPQTIREITWVGNTMYNATSRIELITDGDEAHKLSFKTDPNDAPQTFAVDPPRLATKVTIRNAEFTDLPEKRQTIGCDNLFVRAVRPADFAKTVRPMLNIGGLVEYPQGEGGIVLCNLLFKAHEDVPVNGVKKRTILTALLRNLKAPFAGKTVIAGANVAYTPINLAKQANQWRTERGWFGDQHFTFKDIPLGAQKFAGVDYNIYDFPTSPVPTVVMLGDASIPNNLADNVTGIPVNLKADALFFLQTARVDKPRSAQEIKNNAQPEMAKYLIHYADGSTVNVPILLEQNIDSYKQAAPRTLPGAQIAWEHKYDGANVTAVAYSMEWSNPYPDKTIATIDLVYGADKRGIPALLAVSAAKVE